MDSDAPPSAGFYNFLGWLETNKKRVALGAGVAAFVALAIGLYVWHAGESALEAEEALSAVKMPFSPLESAAPGTAAALAKLAAEYPKTPAAAKALLRAGTVYFGDGDFAKAREQFTAYIRDFGDTPWVPQAVFGLAACLDAENKTAEGISKYKEFISSYPNDPSVDQAKLNQARLHAQNKEPQLAFEILRQLASPAPQQAPSPLAGEAQQKLRDLMLNNPGLMPVQPSATLRPATPGAANAAQPIIIPSGGAPGAPGPQKIQVIAPTPTPANPAPVTPAPATPAPVAPVPATPPPAK